MEESDRIGEMKVSTRLLLAHIGVSYMLYLCLALLNEVPWFHLWWYLPNADPGHVLLSPIYMPLHVVGLVLFPSIATEFYWLQMAVVLPIAYFVGMAIAYIVLTKSRFCRAKLDARRVARIVSGVSLVLLVCLSLEGVRWGPMTGGAMVQCEGTAGWDTRVRYGALGFYAAEFETYARPALDVSVPCWFLMIVTGAVAVSWVRGWRREHVRERRAKKGLCLACGYDLSASGGRCPECGTERQSSVERGGEG